PTVTNFSIFCVAMGCVPGKFFRERFGTADALTIKVSIVYLIATILADEAGKLTLICEIRSV
ncbi:MAG: hypothetical protein WAS32_08000, partial [Tabrizicola sp.]